MAGSPPSSNPTYLEGSRGQKIRGILGWILGGIAWCWLATLRITFLERALPSDARPWVLVFFHGQQFALLRWPRRRPTAVLVSLSQDGDLQTGALRSLGFVVCRGSSSRGGARGLASVIRQLRSGLDAAFAVDGPRGPWGRVNPGALAAARHTGGVLIPLGCASSSSWVLRNAWDRFELPKPFARVVVVVGPALDVTGLDPTSAERSVSAAIHSCREAARRALAPAGVQQPIQPSPPSLVKGGELEG
ncbi:MAG: lysophospholipid acyltransferase family protein [Myxococcales bacterium]|nr:lysophospholipid acyltransferase family protein [Polyangiaceae bacterium]MDW8249321.1 lysophospholipid acyltransferase family protein [Myxococcales bacterium]